FSAASESSEGHRSRHPLRSAGVRAEYTNSDKTSWFRCPCPLSWRRFPISDCADASKAASAGAFGNSGSTANCQKVMNETRKTSCPRCNQPMRLVRTIPPIDPSWPAILCTLLRTLSVRGDEERIVPPHRLGGLSPRSDRFPHRKTKYVMC